MRRALRFSPLVLVGLGLFALRARGDEDAAARLARVRHLEWTRDSSVEQLLDDASPEVRRAAARALGRIAAPGDEIASAQSGRLTARLLERLKKERETPVRLELLLALGQAGTPEAAQTLVAARRGDLAPSKIAGYDDERTTAATALRFAATEASRSDLLEGLKSDLTDVRRDSALALGVLDKKLRSKGAAPIDTATRAALLRMLDERATPALHRALEATHAYVFALGSLADPSSESRTTLARVLESFDDPDVRVEAARGLARSAIGAVASEAAPRVVVDGADARVATEVVHMLAKHRSDPEAILAVVHALKHPSFHVQRAACEALAAPFLVGDEQRKVLDAVALGSLTGISKRESESVRAAALEALARRAPEQALELVKQGAEHRTGVQARVTTARALGALLAAPATKAAARADLEKLVREDKDHRVRMTALGALGDSDEGALPLALEIVAQETDAGVLETALDIVTKTLDPKTEAALAACYERTKASRELAEAREGLVTALGEVGEKLGETGRKTLAQAKLDPVPSVAFAATKALAQVTGAPLPEAPRRERKLAVEPHDFGGKTPVLLFETNRGKFEVVLDVDAAPLHASNVWTLASKGFYDGLSWHRVVSTFVIQGGDPRGDGTGDPGYTIPDEVSARPYVRGTLGMPKSAVKDTGGCQLFFTHGRTPHLDGRYTVFGQIRKGVDVIDLVEEGDAILSVKARLE